MNSVTVIHRPDRFPHQMQVYEALPKDGASALKYKHGKTEVYYGGRCLGYRAPCTHPNRKHGERCPVTNRYRCKWHNWISEELKELA